MDIELIGVFDLIKDAYERGYKQGLEHGKLVAEINAASVRIKENAEPPRSFNIARLEEILAEVLA